MISVLFAYMSTHIGKSPQIKKNSAIFLKKLFAFLSFLPLTIISMVRYDVGRDFLSYRYLFSHYTQYEVQYVEKGIFGERAFVVFNKLLHLFSDNPQVFFVVSSVMICAAYFIAIYRESISPAYSVLLFVISKDYFISLTGIRQYMAIAIAIFSLPLIKNKKWIQAFAVILIAATFHTSILAFLLIYIIYLIEIPPVVGCGITVVIAAFSTVFLRVLSPVLSKFNLYSKYFSNGLDIYNPDRNVALEVLLISLAFYILLCYEYKKINRSKNFRLLYSAVLYSLLISVMTPVLPMSSYRLTWYMNVFIVLYIPETIKMIRNKKIQKFIYYMILISYTGVTLYSLYVIQRLDVLPYQTIWSY